MAPSAIRDAIEAAIHQILRESGRPPRPLADEDALTRQIGLDSLDLAVLVVRLEESLGVDPFRKGAGPVPTFGDLVALYEQHCGEAE